MPSSSHARDVLERSILGGVLLEPDAIALLPALEPDDFADLKCRAVFAAMRNLEAVGKPIDGAMIMHELEREGRSDAIGGMAFLGELAANVPTPENVVAYSTELREIALVGRIRVTLNQLHESAGRSDVTATEVLSLAWDKLGKLDRGGADKSCSIADLTDSRLRELERIADDRARGLVALTGFPTGVADLDAKIGGWQPGIVQLVAARPGMGKSAMAHATANACSGAGLGVHHFSLEDAPHATADRALARHSDVSTTTIRRAEFSRDQTSRLYGTATVEINRRRDHWKTEHCSGITVDEIVRSVRQHRRSLNTKVVIVDYAQIVLPSARSHARDENARLTEIIDTLADAASRDDLAYLVMSQLNREPEKRDDKRPQLADLRGSGSLEQRPKIVIGMYRGAYYGGAGPAKYIDWDCDCRSDTCEHTPTVEDWRRTVQLIVLKQNQGATGTIYARWTGATTRID